MNHLIRILLGLITLTLIAIPFALIKHFFGDEGLLGLVSLILLSVIVYYTGLIVQILFTTC